MNNECIRDDNGFYHPIDVRQVSSELDLIPNLNHQTTLLHYAFQQENGLLIIFLLSVPGTNLKAIDEFGNVPFQYITVKILSELLSDDALSLQYSLIRSHPETFLRLSYEILTVKSHRTFVQSLFNNLQLFRFCLWILSKATKS